MKIQPIKTVFSGEIKQLKIVVNSFDIETKECTLTGIFLSEDDAEIKSLNYTLTELEYDEWGIEDNYLFTIFATFFYDLTGEEIIALK
jgi:hypothetical protein